MSEGFTNPIIGGAETLIRSAMKSVNWVAGLMGWRITRDGDAEFNDVTIRGDFTANGDDGNFISLVTGTLATIFLRPPNFPIAPIPPSEIEPAEILVTTNDFGTDGALELDLLAPHWNPAGGAANKTFPRLILLTPLYGGTFQSAIYLQNSPNDGDLYVEVAGLLRVMNGNLILDNPIQFPPYNVDTGKGRVLSAGLNVNSALIGAAETNIFTFNAFTYKAFRAYRFELDCQLVISVGPNRPAVRLRKTNPAGTQLAAAGVYVSGAASMHNGKMGGMFIVGAADVTATLAVTLQGSGAYTVNTTGSPPTIAEIFDAGDAADYPFGVVLT